MDRSNLAGNRDDECSEVALLERIVEQDQVALEAFYSLYYPRLNRFLSRMAGAASQAVVPGLINEVMFVVWNKAGTYNHTSKVSSWVFGIALRIAKKQLSKQSGYESREQQLPPETEAAVVSADHWESKLESSDLLNKAIAQLSPEQKAVIELTYFNGLHYSEIAEIMDCPENTVKTRMFHARQRLRTLVSELETTDRD